MQAFQNASKMRKKGENLSLRGLFSNSRLGGGRWNFKRLVFESFFVKGILRYTVLGLGLNVLGIESRVKPILLTLYIYYIILCIISRPTDILRHIFMGRLHAKNERT